VHNFYVIVVVLRSTDGKPFNGVLIWAQQEGQICSLGSWTATGSLQTRDCSFEDIVTVCPGQSNALAHSTPLNSLQTEMTFKVPTGFNSSFHFEYVKYIYEDMFRLNLIEHNIMS